MDESHQVVGIGLLSSGSSGSATGVAAARGGSGIISDGGMTAAAAALSSQQAQQQAQQDAAAELPVVEDFLRIVLELMNAILTTSLQVRFRNTLKER